MIDIDEVNAIGDKAHAFIFGDSEERGELIGEAVNVVQKVAADVFDQLPSVVEEQRPLGKLLAEREDSIQNKNDRAALAARDYYNSIVFTLPPSDMTLMDVIYGLSVFVSSILKLVPKLSAQSLTYSSHTTLLSFVSIGNNLFFSGITLLVLGGIIAVLVSV